MKRKLAAINNIIMWLVFVAFNIAFIVYIVSIYMGFLRINDLSSFEVVISFLIALGGYTILVKISNFLIFTFFALTYKLTGYEEE